jgi:hypothetical protein
MTEELRDRQEDPGQPADSGTQGQGGMAAILTKSAEATSQFIEGLKIPGGTTETVVGTILGCLTVRAFTKAWPRLETPVSAAGYVVGGYALYRLAKAAFEIDHIPSDPEQKSAHEIT